jgi:hypothetical protein
MNQTNLRIAAVMLVCFLITGCQNAQHISDPFIVAWVLIASIIGLFFVLARFSNILRDEVNDCEEFDANAKLIQQAQRSKLVDKRNPFSLTKVQFGVWTVIISSSYIYLSLCKGDCAEGPINKTALVLMGIFAGTAVASTIQDKKEIDENRPRHQNSPSRGFFIDMLSDDTGISLHRFQNFVWTMIAMTVYLYKVTRITSGCVLPELSDTLLALTGISSATYLVLRSKENDGLPDDSPALVPVDSSGPNASTDAALISK